MSEMNARPTVVLVAFYNIKALGVRYLETALRNDGFDVQTVFYKGFNSVHPSKTTTQELKLMTDRIRAANPVAVGLSVMSSMYLETVDMVIDAIRSTFPQLPVVCGGAFISMFPEHFLHRDGLDFSIRLDGERALC
ncbi:MAG: cobalamin B12-binding domain-containing protein, partial [Oscillospiraceae bacterium]|nr:cobalamin B12-binding domain-containing protein [Oscillospiraceae bacterium]